MTKIIGARVMGVPLVYHEEIAEAIGQWVTLIIRNGN